MTTVDWPLKSEGRAWLAVALYTVILYATLTVAFDLYVSVYDRIGKSTMSSYINYLFLATAVCIILWLVIWIRPKPYGYAALLMILVALAYCLYQLSIPAKRFHFLQYAPLTLLVFNAVSLRFRNRGSYVWTLLVVSLIGLGDESVQAMLPDRHFGVLDLVLNSTAGLLTLAFIGFVWEPGDSRTEEPRPPVEPSRQTTEKAP